MNEPVSPPSALQELPPSAKLVYTVLEHEGELTQRQLSDETMLSPRTVRYALTNLQTEDLVQEEIYFADARKKLYSLPTAADAASNPE